LRWVATRAAAQRTALCSTPSRRMNQSHFAANNGCYFERAPEKLVLEGYRRWMAGFETGSVAPWETTWALYAELLGPPNARKVMGELSHFVRTLRPLTTAKALDAAVDALVAKPRRRKRWTPRARPGRRRAFPTSRRKLPLRQRHRRRLGRPRERLAAGRGPDRLCRPSYGTESDENTLYTANVIANKEIEIDGKKVDASDHHAGVSVRHAAGGRRHRGQCRHRLSRDRVPALGPGPERHRAGRRQSPLHRLRRQLHRRQLRPPRRLSRRRSDLLVSDLEEMVATGRTGGAARKALLDGDPKARPLHHPDRHGLALLRRTGRRAHEARPAAARSGRGA
jgi:hypothetical protein